MGKVNILLEALVRFVLGGLAVVACFVVSQLVQLKLVAGLFAAFPAIMVASVLLSGYRDGNSFAGEVAKGAVSGMVGCTFTVLAVIAFTNLTGQWPVAIVLALPIWFLASFITNRAMVRVGEVQGRRL